MNVRDSLSSEDKFLIRRQNNGVEASKKGVKTAIILGVVLLGLSLIVTYTLIASQYRLPWSNGLKHAMTRMVDGIGLKMTYALSAVIGLIGIGLILYGKEKLKERTLKMKEIPASNIELTLCEGFKGKNFRIVKKEGFLKLEKVGRVHAFIRHFFSFFKDYEKPFKEALHASVQKLNEMTIKHPEWPILAARYNRLVEVTQLGFTPIAAGNRIAVEKVEKIETSFKAKTKVIERDGRYYYAEGQPNHKREGFFIFLETQIRRLGRLLTLGSCWKFITDEEKQKAYQWDKPEIDPANPTFQNIGHATLLFQLNGFNILTDPVFGGLNALLYPRMTKPGLMPEELPPIDVILITHNHRDHCDIDSLKKFVPYQPVLLVPKGDKKLFEGLGFTKVEEHGWFEKTRVTKKDGSSMDFFSLPSRHWSGRGPFDMQKSMTCSWAFTGDSLNEAVYFRGDTADIPKETLQEIKDFVGAPLTANFEPGGPNYTRCWMESTHQSILDSMISHFEVADKGVNTYLMHHNVFELGSDRFDEGLKIKEKIIQFLETYDPNLELEKQNNWNLLPLFVRKDLKEGRMEKIKKIGISQFLKEMKMHFFSPEIGKKGPLFLNSRTIFRRTTVL